MKALTIEKPGQLVLKDIPVPECGPNEVLIKIAACGICASDLEGIDGIRPEPYIKYPVVLGHEFSGTVQECGSTVTGLEPGDRVTVKPGAHCGLCKYCRRGEEGLCVEDRKEHIEIGFTRDGGFSEYVVARENQVFVLPGSVSWDLATLTEPGACVWTGVNATPIRLGDVVAVIGPGPIGLLAVNYYKALGVPKIIIVGTRDERNELAMKVGATHAINVREEDALARLQELSGGEGPDIIFESAGKVDAVQLALDAVRLGGAVVLAGVAGVGTRIELDCDYFIFRGVRVIGVLGYTPKTFNQSLTMLDLYGEELQQLITHKFALHDYEQAFQTVRERREGVMKAIIVP